VVLPAFGFVRLVPDAGRYLVVSGFQKDLRPGDPWLGLTLTFDNDPGKTITIDRVPVGLPLSPPPRIPGNPSGER
jgi:hypothetical protein